LNVVKGEQAHKCQECGETIDIKQHETERLEAGFNITAHPPEIVAFIKHLGQRVTIKDIQNWSGRDKLIKAGERDGRPVYRVDDVWKLVAKRAGVPERTQKAAS
jgi:hypothetical protein